MEILQVDLQKQSEGTTKPMKSMPSELIPRRCLNIPQLIIFLSYSQALARQLQLEEDARAMRLERHRREEQERRQTAENDIAQNYGSIGNLESSRVNQVQTDKKKRDCIVM